VSKQLDWTPRQIERWWRGRRLQGKPSEMQRFRETTWRFFFYFFAFWLGLYVVIDVSIIALFYRGHKVLVAPSLAAELHGFISQFAQSLTEIILHHH